MSIMGWSITGVIIAAVAYCVIAGIGTMNAEAHCRVVFEAKGEANKSDFDMLKKILGKMAQGVNFEYDKLAEIFNGYADARTPDAKNAAMLWIKESVPNISNTSMQKMLNAIEAQHMAFNMRQKELMALWSEDTDYFRSFPGGLFLKFIGRRPLDKPLLVTSAATKEAFRTGEDNDTDLFPPTGKATKATQNVEQ